MNKTYNWSRSFENSVEIKKVVLVSKAQRQEIIC